MGNTYKDVKKWRQAHPEQHKANVRAYNKRHPDVVAARRKRYNARHKEDLVASRDAHKLAIAVFVEEYKASHGCCICGENFPAAMDFHHLGDKEETISKLSNRSWRIPRVQAEMDKCVLLCANCHRKVHAGALSLDEG